ncbi:hypothetical protein TNCV_1025841 [Trichonephila clavipes]|nr:hypothetical protein TNCV_1025841 [Trichonephila clavipes]
MSWGRRDSEIMSKPKTVFLNRQHNVVCSSRDPIRLVGLQDDSIVEHLVMGLKTSQKNIGLGWALETGGWQFIDQHGHMRRLNQVNLSGFHRSQAKGCDSTMIAKGSRGVFKCVRHSTNIDGRFKAPWMRSQPWRLEQPKKMGELVQSYAIFQFSHFSGAHHGL